MSSTNKTTHYELPQFVENDIFNPLVDDNDAYAKIDTALYNIADAEADDAAEIVTAKGRLDTVEGKVDALETQNGTDVLTTVAQTLSSAVNELKSGEDSLDGRLDVVEDAINNATTGLSVKVAALETQNGSEVLDTTAQTLSGAVNELNKFAKFATPEMYGAVGDGITDDSNAIQTAINENKTVVFSNRTYKISNTIILPSDSCLRLNNCILLADTNDEPLFKTVTSNTYGVRGIKIIGNSALIQGTCSIIFEFNGSNNFNISPTNYARYIQIEGINASSDNIGTFCKMNVAVRDVWISKCTTWCNNGIIADGKAVEVMIDNCILFINSAGYPIKLSSDLGTNLYNEGWQITNCTIDSTDKANSNVYLADFFVYQMCNCYVGIRVLIDVPTTTTHSRDILISNNVLVNALSFLHGRDLNVDFHAVISDNIFMGQISVTRGASIVIKNNKFETAPSGTTYGIILADGISKCEIANNQFDATFAGGIISQGSNFTKTSVHGNVYLGDDGNAYYKSLATYITEYDNNGGVSPNNLVYSIARNATAVGEYILNTTSKLGKGQRGFIMGRIGFTAITDQDARFELSMSSDVVVPNGSGWSSAIMYTRGSQILEFCIPYYAKADTETPVQIKNADGASVTPDYHSWVCITR